MHLELKPHDPEQGSLHISLMQALSLAHSECIMHSGWQFGGAPKYFGKQEHDADPLISRHCELAPQGDGAHGLRYMSFAGSFIGTTNMMVRLALITHRFRVINKQLCVIYNTYTEYYNTAKKDFRFDLVYRNK